MPWRPWRRAQEPKQESPIYYTELFVNEHAGVVRFYYCGVQGENTPIFWAAGGGERITALHFHRRFARDGEWIGINLALVGNSGYSYMPTAALFCPPCGLRLVIPERGLTAQDLHTFFKKWNSHLPIREHIG